MHVKYIHNIVGNIEVHGWGILINQLVFQGKRRVLNSAQLANLANILFQYLLGLRYSTSHVGATETNKHGWGNRLLGS